ncbi:MAG: hypothetical protein ACRC8Y_18205 [Chroococcales cyanobacterium]
MSRGNDWDWEETVDCVSSLRGDRDWFNNSSFFLPFEPISP